MKKKILALAVSGGLAAAPMGAMAAPEVYGLIDIGVEHYTDSDGANNVEIFNGLNSVDGNSDDRDVTLSNGMTSRLGVRGSEDIDFADLTASYNIELQVNVLDDGGNATNTRLGWAALGGDWGKIKVGAQWQALYEFGGWNTHRTDVHGYGTYYYATSVLNDSTRYGFRQDSAISWEYGSAWGHSDPFAAQVTLGIGDGTQTVGGDYAAGGLVTDESATIQNEEGITSIQAAFQYSFDKRISVNAVYHREFSDYDTGVVASAEDRQSDFFSETIPGSVTSDNPTGDTYGESALETLAEANQEPELWNVGARWNVTDALELAANYTLVDLDDADNNKRDAVAIASVMDFGNGLTGHLGFSQASDDRDSETDIDLNTYGFIKQALSDRTNVRLELENIQYDNDANSSATVALVALQHNF
ncbi:porin [uncultured Halovibrio sp.]|uniref:porin n=1 Tax=uncultured Halovibrio sp. TaxID=985049 RepID=UPI0025D5421F|nr:porin [uncultured Halovibrio sp.]